MSMVKKVNPQDAPVLVQCPYSGAIYDFQQMLKMMHTNYFFQEIEKVPDELDEIPLFITQNISEDGNLQDLPKILTKLFLVKEFFKAVNSEIS